MSGSDFGKFNASTDATIINSNTYLFGFPPRSESNGFEFPSSSIYESNQNQSPLFSNTAFGPPNQRGFGTMESSVTSLFGPKPNDFDRTPSPQGPTVFREDPKPSTFAFEPFPPTLYNPDPKPNSFSSGPSFSKTSNQEGVSLFNVDQKPNTTFGLTFPKSVSPDSKSPSKMDNIPFGCRVISPSTTPFSFQSNPKTTRSTPTAFHFSPESLKCFSNIPSPFNHTFEPPQLSGQRKTPMFQVCQNCGHKSLWGQQWGTKGKSYKSTPEIEPFYDSTRSVQSISAMPFYKNKAHEELRWEDYKSLENYNKKGSAESNAFIMGQSRANQFPVINGPALVIPLPLNGIYFPHLT